MSDYSNGEIFISNSKKDVFCKRLLYKKTNEYGIEKYSCNNKKELDERNQH